MTDIFIRSFTGDIQWLYWCLHGLRQHAKGFNAIYVAIPAHDQSAFDQFDFSGVTVCWVQDPPGIDGYMCQQITKLEADLYSNADFICHIDSDIFLKEELNARELFVNGKPIALYRPWEQADEAEVWRAPVKLALLEDPDYEFMLTLPVTMSRATHAGLRGFFLHRHGMEMKDYIISCPLRNFSEFNTAMAFAFKKQNELYHWQNGKVDEPAWVKKFMVNWSWGGISEATRDEFQRCLV